MSKSQYFFDNFVIVSWMDWWMDNNLFLLYCGTERAIASEVQHLFSIIRKNILSFNRYFWRLRPYLEFLTYFLHQVPKLIQIYVKYIPQYFVPQTFGSISCDATHWNFKLRYLELGKWYKVRDGWPLYESQIF